MEKKIIIIGLFGFCGFMIASAELPNQTARVVTSRSQISQTPMDQAVRSAGVVAFKRQELLEVVADVSRRTEVMRSAACSQANAILLDESVDVESADRARQAYVDVLIPEQEALLRHYLASQEATRKHLEDMCTLCLADGQRVEGLIDPVDNYQNRQLSNARIAVFHSLKKVIEDIVVVEDILAARLMVQAPSQERTV